MDNSVRQYRDRVMLIAAIAVALPFIVGLIFFGQQQAILFGYLVGGLFSMGKLQLGYKTLMQVRDEGMRSGAAALVKARFVRYFLTAAALLAAFVSPILSPYSCVVGLFVTPAVVVGCEVVGMVKGTVSQ